MARLGKSIVSKSAFYCACVTGGLAVIAFVALFQVQRRVYEQRLVKDAEESIRRISQTFLGYFYAQGNWVYLEDQQRAFNLTQNVLYNYIVNAEGVIEIGIDGMQSPDVGKLNLPWEPPIPNAQDANGVKLEMFADERLVQKYPQRVSLGERIVLISSPINCLTTREICGHLRTAVIFESIAGTLTQLRLTLVICGILLTVLTTYLIVLTLRRFLSPIRSVSEKMREVARDIAEGKTVSTPLATQLDEKSDDVEETRYFQQSLKEFTSALQRTASLEAELKITRSLSDLAAQVAHDIRSPLAALEVASTNLSELPEDRRIMLRGALTRIRDIANNLINDYQPRVAIPRQESVDPSEATTSTCLLISLVDDILSEKRVQFRSRIGVNIEGKLSEGTYGLFVAANATVLKRVISNIINNAVEAIAEKGEVVVSIRSTTDSAHLEIRDNGKGIPADVLPNLMKKGFSFGKQGGVGLGLHFAKTALEAWGGGVSISSEPGQGTLVTLRLPRISPPAWFVPSLELVEHQTVVVADDDNTIHQVWHGRFDACRSSGVRIAHFSSPEELARWVSVRETSESAPVLFLVDYEFIGNKKNGLEIIRDLGIGKHTVLVTSRFEESDVLAGCKELGVRLIPKSQAGFVPIRMVKLVKVDAVLIDDDALVRDAWMTRLKKRGKVLKTYESTEAFTRESSTIPKGTPIFVDSSLGEGIKGEEFAHQLFERGYTALYLATGYPASSFGEMPWLKQIVSKDPPEWL